MQVDDLLDVSLLVGIPTVTGAELGVLVLCERETAEGRRTGLVKHEGVVGGEDMRVDELGAGAFFGCHLGQRIYDIEDLLAPLHVGRVNEGLHLLGQAVAVLVKHLPG